MKAPTTTRLKLRRLFYFIQTNHFNLQEKWKQEWQENIPTGGDLVRDPTNPQPGFHSLTRKQWTTANRIQTQHGRTATNLHKWGYWDSSTSFPIGYAVIHEAKVIILLDYILSTEILDYQLKFHETLNYISSIG